MKNIAIFLFTVGFLSGVSLAGSGGSWGIFSAQFTKLSEESGVPIEELFVYEQANVVSIHNYGIPYKYNVNWNERTVEFADWVLTFGEVIEEVKTLQDDPG